MNQEQKIAAAVCSFFTAFGIGLAIFAVYLLVESLGWKVVFALALWIFGIGISSAAHKIGKDKGVL